MQNERKYTYEEKFKYYKGLFINSQRVLTALAEYIEKKGLAFEFNEYQQTKAEQESLLSGGRTVSKQSKKLPDYDDIPIIGD